mgnify:CR=1 FL=1
MATNSFLGFSEDGTELFEMKSKMARQVGNDVSAGVKTSIRTTLGVPGSAEGLTPSNNLSDVSSASTSRTNLDVMTVGDVNDRQLSKAPRNLLSMRQAADVINGSGLSAIIGLSDFSIEWTMAWHVDAGANQWVIQAGSTGNTDAIKIDSAQKIVVRMNATDYVINKVLTVHDEQKHYLVTCHRSGNATLYINGVAQSGGIDISAQVAYALASSGWRINETSTSTVDATFGGVRVWNCLPTAAEIADLSAQGTVPERYLLGAVASYTSDFSAGQDGFTDVGTTTTGNYDSGDGGHADTLRVVAADGSSDRSEKASLFTAGQRYRIELNYKMVVGSSGLLTAAGVTLSGALGVAGWTAVVYEFTAVNTDPFRAYAANSGSASDEILVDGIVVTPLGVAFSHDFGDADLVNGVSPDKSPNGLNGVITGSAALFQSRSLHINAPSPAADEKLLTVSVAGVEKLAIDEDGTIRQEGLAVDAPVGKYAAEAITSAGTVSQQIAIDIGGTTYYLVAYTHGS